MGMEHLEERDHAVLAMSGCGKCGRRLVADGRMRDICNILVRTVDGKSQAFGALCDTCLKEEFDEVLEYDG